MIIKNIRIQGFRSLQNIEILDLKQINIFHGENNSGKSNLLKALAIFFKNKNTEVKYAETGEEAIAETDYDKGYLYNFTNDNYYNHILYNIKIELDILFNDKEKKIFTEIPDQEKQLLGQIIPTTLFKYTMIIKPKSNDKCYCYISKIDKVDNTNILNIFEFDGESITTFFSQDKSIGNDLKEKLLNIISKNYVLVSSERFLKREFDNKKQNIILFNNNNIKQSLFTLSLSKDAEDIKLYNGINDFCHQYLNGHLRFYRSPINNEINIMIEKNGDVLPIDNYGTGYQQLLMLVSNILNVKAKILGLEEIELNLSYKSQDILMKKIYDLIYDENNTINQILLSSHSPHISMKKNYYKVEINTNSETKFEYIKEEEKDTYWRFPVSAGWSSLED